MLDVRAGQGVVCMPGEWVRYSTPTEEGAEYIAVCLPAFSPGAVRRLHAVFRGRRAVTRGEAVVGGCVHGRRGLVRDVERKIGQF